MLREIERILRFRVRNWRYVECITYKICLEYICKQTPTWLIQTCLHLVCVLYINLLNALMPWMSTTRWVWHASDFSLVVYSSVHLSLVLITELTTWILIIMPMRVHMGVMTLGCTAVTPMDRVTPLTSPTVVSIIRTSGPLMVHEYPSTVAVVIETFPEW